MKLKEESEKIGLKLNIQSIIQNGILLLTSLVSNGIQVRNKNTVQGAAGETVKFKFS